MISIDFWNTIVIAASNGSKRHQARIGALFSVIPGLENTITEPQIKAAHQYASQKFDEIWLGDHRTPTSAELVDFVLLHLGLDPSPEERQRITKKYQDSLFAGPPELTPGVGDALEELASRHKLAIISDTMFSPGTVLREYLKSQKLSGFFSAFAFSDEVGVSKPHSDMYKKVLSETGCAPERSWHIGDIHQTDIKGAQVMGMGAVLYTGINKADRETTTADHVSDEWSEIPALLN